MKFKVFESENSVFKAYLHEDKNCSLNILNDDVYVSKDIHSLENYVDEYNCVQQDMLTLNIENHYAFKMNKNSCVEHVLIYDEENEQMLIKKYLNDENAVEILHYKNTVVTSA